MNEANAIFGVPESHAADLVTDEGKKPESPLDLYLVAGSYAQATYFYSVAQPPVLGGGDSIRKLFLEFRNNLLVGYDFYSSFPNDSSNFDANRADAIVKGRTDRAQVVQLLGQPSGRTVFPMVANETDEKYIYDFFTVEPSAGTTTRKTLEILFNQAGIVKDTRFRENTAPIAQAPGGGGFVGVTTFVHGGGHGGGGGGHK